MLKYPGAVALRFRTVLCRTIHTLFIFIGYWRGQLIQQPIKKPIIYALCHVGPILPLVQRPPGERRGVLRPTRPTSYACDLRLTVDLAAGQRAARRGEGPPADHVHPLRRPRGEVRLEHVTHPLHRLLLHAGRLKRHGRVNTSRPSEHVTAE